MIILCITLHKITGFLAHLSRRLTGELIGYPWIRRPSSASVRLASVHIFKRLLLRNRLANRSQILCGASLGGGTKVCINGPGHMTKMAAMPIYGKNLKHLNRLADFHKTWYVASGTPAHHSLYK